MPSLNRFSLKFSVILAVFSILCLGLAVYFSFHNHRDDSFAPLEKYPTQKVINGITINQMKTFVVGESVRVSAKKCNSSDKYVLIVGKFRWQSNGPKGFFSETIEGSRVAKPGCETFEYSNPMPDEVIEYVKNRGDSVMVITGEDIPISADGSRTGVPGSWTTESFRVVNKDDNIKLK